MKQKNVAKLKDTYLCIRLGNGLLIEKRTTKLISPKKLKKKPKEKTYKSYSIGCKKEGINMEYFLQNYFGIKGELLDLLKTKTHRELKIATKDLEKFKSLQGVPFDIAHKRRYSGEIIWVVDRKYEVLPYKNPLKQYKYDNYNHYQLEWEDIPDYDFIEEEFNERFNIPFQKSIGGKRRK